MRSLLFVAFFSGLIFLSEAEACDPCALYNASRLQGHTAGTFTFSVSEQFTDYDKASNGEDNSIRDGELVREYSTTQFALAYDVTENFGVQLTLPVIARRFDNIEQYRTNTESDSGFGDLSLAGTYSFINYKKNEWTALAGFTGGVKFPTGDTGALEDLVQDEEEDGYAEEKLILKHHQIGSTSSGRALTFGSGSYDYILGLNLLSRYQRYVFLSYAQYTIRTEGDFNYEYSDDFLWSIGPGYYFLLEHEYTIAGLITFSGESKSKDKLNGQLVSGSDASNLYVGPEVILSWTESIGMNIGLDFRVTNEDADSTIVPDMRLRANVSYRFS